MTKQLFSDLNDLAAEQVVGGKGKPPVSTFYTAKIDWADDGDGIVQNTELTYNGYNTLTKGRNNNAQGATGTSYTEGANNIFSDSTSIDQATDQFIYVVGAQQFSYNGDGTFTEVFPV